MIGHYPEYVNLADEIGGERFSIPTERWNAMTEAERWSANREFLDRAVERGDTFRLATPLEKMRPGTYFEKEVQYLTSRGYQLSGDGTSLVPPTGR